jgi:hypothetical protein
MAASGRPLGAPAVRALGERRVCSDGTLRVRDDGVGGANAKRGTGLIGLKDRIEGLNRTFSLRSPAGGGTTVSCELAVGAGNQPSSTAVFAGCQGICS